MYSSQLSNFQILIVIMPSDNDSDLANSLSDLKEELRSGFFSSLKRELVEENTLAIKKLTSTASSTPKFKKKGNEKQFEVNSQVLDHVHSASSFLTATPPQVEKALEELKEGEKKLAHRNKLILIADSAEEGWEVVNEYQRRDLAEDSDDDKRIRRAEARAFQKRRRAQSQKKRPNFSQGLPYPPFTSTVRASSPVPLLQPSVFPAAFQNPYTGSWPKASPGLRGGSCFACGKFGHFRSQFPVPNYQPSANQPNKSL